MCHSFLKPIAAILLLVLAGCGASPLAPVQGTVTANGKNVEEGYVNFMPLDSKNPTYGAEIKNGRYNTRLNPGSYSVMVTGGKGVAYPKSQADLKAIPDKDLQIADEVPADAKGNGQKVEIKAGGQEFNITLEYGKRK